MAVIALGGINQCGSVEMAIVMFDELGDRWHAFFLKPPFIRLAQMRREKDERGLSHRAFKGRAERYIQKQFHTYCSHQEAARNHGSFDIWR